MGLAFDQVGVSISYLVFQRPSYFPAQNSGAKFFRLSAEEPTNLRERADTDVCGAGFGGGRRMQISFR